MSQLVTFNSSSYNIPTTSEVGWSTTVTNFLADVGANALDKASTQTISGAKTFTGTINFTSATLAGFHTLGFTDNAIGPTLTLDSSNNVVIANNASVGGTFAVTGTTTLAAVNVTGATTLAAVNVTGAVTLTTALPLAQGGTAATSASAARTSLGVAIGTNVQAWDADLDTFAALSTAATNEGQIAMVGASGGWSLSSNQISGRNKIINGDMRIDQRNIGGAVTPSSTAYTADRWQHQASTGSKLTFQVVATALAPGFPTALKFTVASTFTPGAGDVFSVRQAIEGYSMSDLMFGTANAKTITVSFWVQSAITGTYNIALQSGSGLRTYGATYTIAVANTAQFVTLTIPGDTAGSWATDNTAGLWLQFDLGSGSTFTFAAGAWSANALYSATGATKFVSQANGSTFFISGVQLEVGSVATPFERRPYGAELALCQRYYAKCYDILSKPGAAGDASGLSRDFSFANNVAVFNVAYPVRMRTGPTFTTYSYSTGSSGVVRDETAGGDVAATATSNGQSVGLVTVTTAGSAHQVAMLWSADAEM